MVQIVVRADGARGPRPQRVQLALSGVEGVSCDPDCVLGPWDVEMTVAECGASVAVHAILLSPGCVCEISATPLGACGVVGAEVRLQLQVPSASEFAALF